MVRGGSQQHKVHRRQTVGGQIRVQHGRAMEKNIEKEWLITNGIGGYASSTVLGINTRKYHGLLVSALKPPGSRTVLLEKLDEDIIVNDQISRFGSK